MTLRELLNEARWKTGALHAWSITVVHRGAPGDERVVSGARIHSVLAAGLEVMGDASDSDTVFLPYHRFVEIRGSQGQLVWRKGEGIVEAGQMAEVSASSPKAVIGAGGDDVETCADVEVRREIPVVMEDVRGSRGLLTIDGAAGEGGGQILRTSLTLSMLTGRPLLLKNIRGGRRKPGLMRQHLTCVRAAAQVCDATVQGADLGSSTLRFNPGEVRAGDVEVAVGTAGSVALVLQTVLVPLCLQTKRSVVRISGGTHARWAPPWPFLEASFLPLIARMGAPVEAKMHAAGFYPAGGGSVELSVGGGQAAEFGLGGLFLNPRRGRRDVSLTAVVANLSESVARRELAAAADVLGDESIRLQSQTLRGRGPGTAIWLTASGDDVTNVFTAIGERGTSAEDVGRACASRYLHWRESDTAVDEYLADQLLIPIAVAGAGSFTTVPLSKHAWTNLAVIEAFTGKRFKVSKLDDERFRVALQAT